ncbi:hypothetical protein ACHAWX_003844 [Stephanocyclus meneghinianus]
MLDSGATSHYSSESDDLPKTNNKTKLLATASGQLHTTTGKAELPCPQLEKAARTMSILPALQNNSLMSVKQLADNGYTTIFHPFDRGATVHASDMVEFIFKDQTLLQESHQWHVTSPSKTKNEQCR